ncbi:hypothetical protein BU17DRAFT_62032 [Hysterangium stoloniferum]|nr:hypothetical protein BU17DRAFT_62032 [Hysterangium stoloniferum]
MSATNVSRTRPLPRPLHLVTNSISTPSSPLSTTPNDLKSATSSGATKEVNSSMSRNNTPRRQSSISYNTGSPKPQSPGLVRSNSTGINTQSTAIIIKEQTDQNCAPRASPLPAVRETGPVTLAERHADLLRFIAQKESKCLELRTQLAQHEAELLLLKGKWGRIVSKGVPSSSRSDASIYAAVDMLGDIREGVQHGLEKVLAVLEPNAVNTSSQSSASNEVSPTSAPAISPPSSSKRTSISTASSTRGSSSHSNSRSSASSLFDDVLSLNPKSLDSPVKDDDDDNEETVCLSGADKLPSETKSLSRTFPPTGQPLTLDEDDATLGKKRHSRPLSISLSPTVEALTPISKQMANWVPPGLNKKWEELTGNETISKHSRRATLLFNDMLAVLSSPAAGSPQTPSPSASTRNNNRHSRRSPISPLTTDRPFFATGTLLSAGFGSKASVSPSSSLLDDTDFGSGVVMQPDVVSMPDRTPQQDDNTKPESENEEDEWNW